MIHDTPHPLSGKTVRIKGCPDKAFVEDWADRLLGQSWLDTSDNLAVWNYAIRSLNTLPQDDEVVGCKIEGMSTLIHVTEIEP